MHIVEAQKWNRDLGFVDSVDRQMGNELQKESNPVLLVHLEELLLKAESELKFRDQELLKNIEIITGLYASYRYRVGRFLIKPIETLAIRLRLMPKSTADPDHLYTQNFGHTHND
jgi:hypothetical protein